MKKYDYVIVGAGLFGACFAHLAGRRGKKCLVIDRRAHMGGNCHCENVEGINVHSYGAHIFHTSDRDVWSFVNSLVEFNNFVNSPVANFRGRLFNLPFNMNTFHELWGTVTPEEAEEQIRKQREACGITEPKNLEEQAIALVGKDIYEILIKGYTEKQWGRKCCELPASIIRRLPVRFTFDNNYFSDRWQGIPEGGYNRLFEKLLASADFRPSTDFFDNPVELRSLGEKLVYTGPIDRYFGYRYGKLEYRTVRFETETLDIPNFQGVAVMNYTDSETPFTRIIEHKHFEFGRQEKTVISREYPSEWSDGSEPYYPINDGRNTALYSKYKALADAEEGVIFGGRLAEYKYYDMHHVIASVLHHREFDNQ